MPGILIAGPNIVLGMHIAVQSLLSSSDAVCMLLDEHHEILAAKIHEQVGRIVAERIEAARLDAHAYVHGNLSIIIARADGANEIAAKVASLDLRQTWFLSGCSPLVEDIDADRSVACTLISALARFGTLCFNYVRPSYSEKESPLAIAPWESKDGATTGIETKYKEAEKAIISACRASGLDCGLYCVGVLAGREVGFGSPLSPLDLALSSLYRFKTEIEERNPEYFDYHALRCYAPQGVRLNVIPVEEVSALLVATAGERKGLGARQHILSERSIPFSQLCDWIGNAYDLSLLAVDSPDELNSIDRLFGESLVALQACLLPDSDVAERDKCNEVVAPVSGWADKSFALSVLKELREGHAAAVREHNQRVASLASELQPLSTVRNGSELSYFATGTGGTPVVLVNALGQGLRYWQRLMSELAARHRVLIWEQRGIGSPQAFRLADHVEDLEAILANEGVTRCHLVAWCTGPKIAIEFYRRHPESVASMAFLNSAFKCFSTPEELTTEYERNLEPLFRLVDSTPATAGVVMKSLQQCATGGTVPSAADMNDEEIATRVLSLINRDLLAEVVVPFKSESGTVNYARQILDFYSQDVSAYAPGVHVPVLLIGAEYDGIASPAMSREFAKLFPEGRYVEVKGATHYCLYDRAEFLSRLIEDFFAKCEQEYHDKPAVEQLCNAGSTTV